MSTIPVMSASLRPAIVIITAAFLLVPARVTFAQTASARPRGEWRLDPARSDSLPRRAGMRGAGRWAGSEPGPGEPGGGGPGVGAPGESGPGREGAGRFGGGRRPRLPDARDLDRMHQTLALARHAPVRITIRGDLLTLTDSAGDSTALRVGRSSTEQVVGGGDVETKTHWQGDFLVIEHKVKGGGRVTETFRQGLGSGLLLDFVEVDGPFEPMSFRRVYQAE